MVINHSYHDNTLIIALPKKLDTDSAPVLEVDLKEAMKNSFQNLLFDCSGMDYISSAGIRVLLSTSKELLKSGKKVGFCCLTPNVRQIFEIGGFTKIFRVFNSRDSALKGMG